MSFMLCKSVTRETCICLQHHNALGATLYPNLQLNGYRCAGILSKMPFSRTAVPESRQKQPQPSVLDKRNSGLLFWQYTLVKKQRKLRQSAFRIAPHQAQANLCEPSDLARTDWLELMAVIFARVGVNLKRIPKSTQIFNLRSVHYINVL